MFKRSHVDTLVPRTCLWLGGEVVCFHEKKETNNPPIFSRSTRGLLHYKYYLWRWKSGLGLFFANQTTHQFLAHKCAGMMRQDHARWTILGDLCRRHLHCTKRSAVQVSGRWQLRRLMSSISRWRFETASACEAASARDDGWWTVDGGRWTVKGGSRL